MGTKEKEEEMTLCQSCKLRPKQKHANAKWCKPCAENRRKRPKSTLTAVQRHWVKKHIGKMPVSEMAEKLGTSTSNIKRAFRGVSIWFQNGKLKNNRKLVKQVLDYYSANGWRATEKAFPKVKIKSIVNREAYYGFKVKPRQIRWTNDEIILAAKMAGLISSKRQAKIFNRPRANEGSIRALWAKRFQSAGGNVHGMSEWMAKQLLLPGYPVVKTRMWAKRIGSKESRHPMCGLVLWCEMEPFLRTEIPNYIRDAIKAMADFQKWLFKTNDPSVTIRTMIKENV